MNPRLVGAIAGAVVGLLAIAALFAVGRVTGLAESIGLALVVGEDGIFSPTRGAPLAWAVPPLAAGLVGAGTGPTAARGVRWAGTWMGVLTYGLGIVIGALVLVVPLFGGDVTASAMPSGSMSVVSVVVGVATLILVGSVVFAPVLLLCVAAGVGWAAAVRRLAPLSLAVHEGKPIIVLAVVATILGVLWFMLVTFLDILVDSQSI